MQKTQQIGVTISLCAEENIAEHTLVGVDGKMAAAGANAAGVCLMDTETCQDMPVAISGAVLVKAGGLIAAGDDIAAGANGVAVKHTTGKVLGMSLNAATTNDLVKVILR